MTTQPFFNPALYNKTVTDDMHRQSVVMELSRNGMEQYRCKKIKKFQYLSFSAKDSVAVVNCYYVKTIKEASRILRECR